MEFAYTSVELILVAVGLELVSHGSKLEASRA